MRALAGWNVRGLSRRAPLADEPWERLELQALELADRRDVGALARLCEGADLVIDGVGFASEDAQALLDALDGLKRPPSHLIFASSVAELGAAMGGSETAERAPQDNDGKGKLAARRLYERAFAGTVHGLILPRLVAPADPGRREAPYLQAATGGQVLLPCKPEVAQVIAPVEGVAAVVRALAEDPGLLPSGPLNVGPPHPVKVGDCVTALLEGAQMKATASPHPDPSWRGPHGGGPEPLDTALLQRTLPALPWPDPLEVYRALGAWLAAHPQDSGRPSPLVRKKHQQWQGREVIDVHGARDVPLPRHPLPDLLELARWLSPSFYLDTGRPCNSSCVYCAVPPHLDTHGFTPLSELRRQIDRGVRAGCTRAILIGGEPTIYPELDGALEALTEAGLEGGHIIMTNGLRLARDGFVERLVRGGVQTFHLSVDTVDPEVYARLSRIQGRFGDQMTGLDNALGHPDAQTYVYTAVTRQNADGLGDLLQHVVARCEALGRPTAPVILAFVKPVGDALVHAAQLLMSPQERARVGREAVSRARQLGVPVALRSIQACLVPELVPYLFDYYVDDHSVALQSGERRIFAHHESYMGHLEVCTRCDHRRVCPGVYLEEHQEAGYTPLFGERGALAG